MRTPILAPKVWHPKRYHTIGDERMALNRIARRLQYDEEALVEWTADSIVGQAWLQAWKASVEAGNAENVSPAPKAVYERMADMMEEVPEWEDELALIKRYISQLA